ncbi:hypothetical protein, partial [Citrobacter youngae]|uniref:hypothetical protein n=1 Tax=Citrobacter youngae TaxID=133448 RepID=UPI001954486E
QPTSSIALAMGSVNFSMKGFAGFNIIGMKLSELFSQERAERIMSYVNLALMENTVVEFDLE